MDPAKIKRLIGVLILVVAIGVVAYYYQTAIQPATVLKESGALNERIGGYFTVVDETGRTVFTTGHFISVGDEFISEDDTRYQITMVNEDTATAKSVGKMEVLPMLPVLSVQTDVQRKSVAIYHTHSDESFRPSDGSDSKPGAGGVFQVGASLAESLENQGIDAVHSTTSHDPHDAAAYDRSRRTAVQLLKDRPLALFDVHRDAGPAEAYLKEIGGEEVAKTMIVVGRTNPKMNANLDFARRLKDSVNGEYPGLIKGIFLGKADFNQDLYDRSLLLEIGTEQTSREAAEAGAALIGKTAPRVLGGVTGGPSPGVSGKAIGWILGLTVAGTFVYLWVSTGSWEEMRSKILSWFGSGGIRTGGGRKDGDGSDDSGPEDA